MVMQCMMKMYNDVACMDFQNCNKRISYAGPEWSAGRPGHTPIRRDLACGNIIEDSCAGPDWSAGRPDLMSFGASTAPCLSSQTACLGPYGAAYRQPHYTGPNPREETSPASSSQRDILPSTSQQTTASPSRRNAAEDRASPATVALQPRRPPYFHGGLDEDVHTWTSIITRWLGTIQGEPIAQLTFVVSLLRGAAYDWYHYYETRTGCPGDWTTLRQALLQRFGTSIRAEKARAGLYQLRQDNMTVLQYADAFESRLAQIENYDESYYLVHFIFGLRPEIMRGVYLQQPTSILAAKEMAEKLELTHQCTASHQTHTKTKKTNKAARQRGTQERRSGSWRKSDTVQLKACQSQYQRQKRRPRMHSTRGCTAQSGAFLEASCPERHGPAAVWRSLLKDLPQGDRTGRLRRQGSVVIASLEALTRAKETTSADTTEAGMSMHPPSGGPKAPRVYLRNRLLRRDRERRTRERVRERQYAAQLLETLVSPTRGGTESCEGAAARQLQDWQSLGLKRAIAGKEEDEGSSKEPQTQLSAVVAGYQSPVPRSEEDGILLIVPARIFGQELRALIDSGASTKFYFPGRRDTVWSHRGVT